MALWPNKRRMTGKTKSGQRHFSVNNIVAEISRLQSDRSFRDNKGVFYIEGIRNFVGVSDNGFDITLVFYSEKLLTAPLARKFVRRFRRAGIPTVRVSPEEFRQVSKTEHASGIGAIVRQRWACLDEKAPTSGLCWIVLERVRSAGNLGTLIRSSEAFGGAGFILVGRSIDPYSPQTVRASMGGIYEQHLIRTSLQSLQHWIANYGGNVVCATPDGTLDLHSYHFQPGTLLVLGEEREGLTPQLRKLLGDTVRIPMMGNADSLNLGVAGSVLLYEIYRSYKKLSTD